MNQIERDTMSRRVEERLRAYDGVEVVETNVFCSQGNTIVRIIVDVPDGGIPLSMCARINRDMVAFMEQEFPAENVSVEVNSPGLDRPLRSQRDFERQRGKKVGIWLTQAVSGGTYVEGEVTDVSEQGIFLQKKDDQIHIPLASVIKGKQILEWR